MTPESPTKRQTRILWSAITSLSIAVILGLIAGMVWGLSHVMKIMSPVLWPLAIAGVLAYLLDPLVDWFEKWKLKRARAITCVFAIALAIVTAVGMVVIPQLVTESRQLVSRIPDYGRKIENRVQQWIDEPPGLLQNFLKRGMLPAIEKEIGTNAVPETAASPATNAPPEKATTGQAQPGDKTLDKQTLQTAASLAAKSLPKVGSWVLDKITKVASMFGLLAGMVLIPVYLFYLLLEKRNIKSNWTDYLPVKDSDFKTELVFVLRAINDHLVVFFRGQVLVAICNGIMYTIGFLIIDLPYGVLLGMLAIILTIVPFIGAVITFCLAMTVSIVQYGDWQHPAKVLAVVVVVQSIESFFITPKVMGDRVGLHPLTIIVAVMAGTTLLGGLLGGVLAIPLTAAGKVIMQRYVWKTHRANHHHAH